MLKVLGLVVKELDTPVRHSCNGPVGSEVNSKVMFFFLQKVSTSSASLCLYRIGTAGIAVQVVGSNWPKPHYTLLITGLCRFSVARVLKERPFVLAEVTIPLSCFKLKGDK